MPPSWETQREEEHRIALHNTVMDRPSPCSQHHRGRHPGDTPAHLCPGPQNQPESFSAVLSRPMTKKKSSFLLKAVEPISGGGDSKDNITTSDCIFHFFSPSLLTSLTIIDSLTDLISVWISHSSTEIKNVEIKSFKQ